MIHFLLFQKPENETAVLIALIGSAAAILTALRADKWPMYIYNLWKDFSDGNSEKKQVKKDEIQELNKRIDELEDKLGKERMQMLRMQSILTAMLPLMRRLMKDYPEHIELLDELEKNIFGEMTTTSADGSDKINKKKRV